MLQIGYRIDARWSIFQEADRLAPGLPHGYAVPFCIALI